MLIPMNVLLTKLLNAAIDHAVAGPFSGPLDGVYIGLSIAPTTAQAPVSTLSNITEAGFTGYARQLVVWHPAYDEAGGAIAIQSSSTYWTPSDAVLPETITGMFLADAIVAGNLLAAEMFAVPQPLAGPSNAFSLAVLFAQPPNSNYGGATIIN
jgi:hypothetical protein